jgi:hypothetical protein
MHQHRTSTNHERGRHTSPAQQHHSGTAFVNAAIRACRTKCRTGTAHGPCTSTASTPERGSHGVLTPQALPRAGGGHMCHVMLTNNSAATQGGPYSAPGALSARIASYKWAAGIRRGGLQAPNAQLAKRCSEFEDGTACSAGHKRDVGGEVPPSWPGRRSAGPGGLVVRDPVRLPECLPVSPSRDPTQTRTRTSPEGPMPRDVNPVTSLATVPRPRIPANCVPQRTP